MQGFLTCPTSCSLYPCLSLHDLNSQASSQLLPSLRLFPCLARCSRVGLQANVCERHIECVYGFLNHVCSMCAFLWDLLFLSPLSVLRTEVALNPLPYFSFLCCFLCLLTACLRLSHQVSFVLSLRLLYMCESERKKTGRLRGKMP